MITASITCSYHKIKLFHPLRDFETTLTASSNKMADDS